MFKLLSKISYAVHNMIQQNESQTFKMKQNLISKQLSTGFYISLITDSENCCNDAVCYICNIQLHKKYTNKLTLL